MSNQQWRNYSELENQIGNTPLILWKQDKKGNKIYVKQELKNPSGNHADRFALKLIKEVEEKGRLRRGDTVVEPTTGSVGIAVAYYCAQLGLNAHILIPEGLPRKRISAIERHGATVEQVPGDYVNAFPQRLRALLTEHPTWTYLGHSMGRHGSLNHTTLDGLADITRETMEELPETTHFIAAVGNGSSIAGPFSYLSDHRPDIMRIAGDNVYQAVLHQLVHPGEYEKVLGISPGALGRHKIWGTSYKGIEFPAIQYAVEEGLVDNVKLFGDEHSAHKYGEITGQPLPPIVSRLDEVSNADEYGKSTKGLLAVAQRVAETTRNARIVVIGYDGGDLYSN